MLLYVINKDLERESVIEVTDSIIWNNRYYTPGELELYIPATKQIIDDLQLGKIIVRADNEENGMIVESIQIQTDKENGDYLTIKGRCLKSILYRRIIWEQTNLQGTLEGGIERLLKENVIQPENPDRKIECIKNGNTLKTGINLKRQYTGSNLGETIEALCTENGLGWDLELDIENKTMYFYLYKGEDRSWQQEKNTVVTFSEDYENLAATDYLIDATEYKNVAKVAGEGEGLQRKNKEIGTATGMDRIELYVDARDLSSNEGEITEEEYYKNLTERGQENLAENSITKEFNGTILEFTNIYGRDFFLGDIVEVQNKYGVGERARITEVIYSESSSGIETIPTFTFE